MTPNQDNRYIESPGIGKIFFPDFIFSTVVSGHWIRSAFIDNFQDEM